MSDQTSAQPSAPRRSERPRIALVTGAGSGIGAASAIALADAGWTVILVGRRVHPLQELATDHPQLALEPSPADVTDENQVADLFAGIRRRHGRLDLLFNNAGMGAPARELDEIPLSEWQRVVDVNLTGTFLCTRAAFGQMRRQDPQGGRIINNGSISAHTPRPQSIAYTATKHAVTGLTKSTALDGRPYDIACSQIDIGNAATDMTTPMADGIVQADGSRRSEPRMDVTDVARAVVYMASLPLSANVLSMTVMATKMPYVGRG
ncbi:MAG TPA: SDR family oxidoreductase [Microlunatus sp.]|nr:SDR family oxidoreductase [Microlunatus sp.]